MGKQYNDYMFAKMSAARLGISRAAYEAMASKPFSVHVITKKQNEYTCLGFDTLDAAMVVADEACGYSGTLYSTVREYVAKHEFIIHPAANSPRKPSRLHVHVR